jgi:hypothetical protein
MANIRLNDLYDIEDLALETGATVEYASGRKFNTSGREAARKPKPVAVPTPVESAPVKPDVSAELLRQMIAVLNRPVDVRLPEMPAPQVTVTPAAPEYPSISPCKRRKPIVKAATPKYASVLPPPVGNQSRSALAKVGSMRSG